MKCCHSHLSILFILCRSRRHRRKKKKLGEVIKKSTVSVLTKRKRQKKKDYWRRKKAESRARMDEKCANIDHMGRALLKYTTHTTCKSCATLRHVVTDHLMMSNATMCPKKGPFPAAQCIRRECNSCGVYLLTDKIRHLGVHNLKVLDWYRWEHVEKGGKKKLDLCAVNG